MRIGGLGVWELCRSGVWDWRTGFMMTGCLDIELFEDWVVLHELTLAHTPSPTL